MYAVPHNRERPSLTFRALKSWICKCMQNRCYRCWRTNTTWPIRLPRDWWFMWMYESLCFLCSDLHQKRQKGSLFSLDHLTSFSPSVKRGVWMCWNMKSLFAIWHTAVVGDTYAFKLTDVTIWNQLWTDKILFVRLILDNYLSGRGILKRKCCATFYTHK